MYIICPRIRKYTYTLTINLTVGQHLAIAERGTNKTKYHWKLFSKVIIHTREISKKFLWSCCPTDETRFITLRKEIFARINFREFFFGHFAGINFRE